MLTVEQISTLARKYQTGRINVLREYIQNLFLSYFYQQKDAENFLFKGGTALRIAYGSPRFSEDLDFSGIKNGGTYEKVIERTIYLISQSGEIDVDISDSKSTSGGWLSSFAFDLHGTKIRILNEVSYRNKESSGDFTLVTSDFIPPYKAFILDPRILVEEKIAALTSRKKARDVFDLYFILRNAGLRKFYDPAKKPEIISILNKMDNSEISKGLSEFLPESYHVLLKNLAKKIIDEL